MGFIGHKFHIFILAKANRLEFGECSHGNGQSWRFGGGKSQATAKTFNPRNFMKSCSRWLSDPGTSENQFASLTLSPQHSTRTQRIPFSVYKLNTFISPSANASFASAHIPLSPLQLAHRFPTNIRLPISAALGYNCFGWTGQGNYAPRLTRPSKLGLSESTVLPVRKHYSSKCSG